MANTPPPVVPELPRHARKFDRDQSLPTRLQRRIDDWETSPPTNQFSAYGPIASFLFLKFPPEFFLVKPQALLSTVSSLVSTHHHRDSHGVDVKQDRRYPDFTVCQYFGPAKAGQPSDVTRIVYEIGTEDNDRAKLRVTEQVAVYMRKVKATRYDESLLGIGQVGNQVALYTVANNWRGMEPLYPDQPRWISMFNRPTQDNPGFVGALNKVVHLAYQHDGALKARTT